MTAKKKTPARKSVPANVEASGGAQSAADRRAAEAELGALVAKFTPTQSKLVSTLRKSLRKLLPSAHEVVYEYRDCFVVSFSPSEHGYEGVLAIRGSAEGVKLYFNQGKDLPDPEKLLNGTSQTRFIDVENASTLTRPPVVRLIEAALEHNRVPFASIGVGTVVVRLTTAKKKGQQRRTTKASSTSKTKS